ncbi:hypothetical protein IE077_002668 [Cardiosporidium cionae]|uniref:Uncharacterized protein n=1 Tax=Cardiosporidium cionae TaxID=476202 RepID=A0ABQ7JA91_9APIC|nr:hypothetical protein IE077_002668 [Cardiosporidium cionae]|eukprot:KAF8820922.1 hypothetical protein IE077_002668 [Cardiosporidium cionae]
MKTQQQSIERGFFLIASLAAVSSLSRADCNLPFFLFLWFSFFHFPQEATVGHDNLMIILIVLSMLQDILYLIYWPAKLFAPSWLSISPSTYAIHVAVTLTSILELLLKIPLLAALWSTDQTPDVYIVKNIAATEYNSAFTRR